MPDVANCEDDEEEEEEEDGSVDFIEAGGCDNDNYDILPE